MPRFSSSLSFFFIFNLPCFILCTDDYRYSNCSVPFNCGITISYPFWGYNQAEYCGQPGFQLDCVNGSPIIQIKSRTYRVLEMKPDTESMIIAETESWNESSCPIGNKNYHAVLDQTPFIFSDSINRNITLFYDCPPLRTELPNKFQCGLFTKSTDAWIAVDPKLLTHNNPELLKCNITIVVPVLGTAFSKFNPVELELKDVLKTGFEVKYSVNASICDECERSGGQCGYDKDKKQPECYCPDGPYQRSCPNGHSRASRTFSAKIGQKGQKGRFCEYLLKSVSGQTFSTFAASRHPSTASRPFRRNSGSRSTSGPLAREPRQFSAVLGLGLGQRALARSRA